MIYHNPVLCADYSDPDVIRVGDDFYLVASSFNYVPGVPLLHSKNLVEWRPVNYIIKELPFARFDKVCQGDGAWAPSLRFHGGKFYCVIPFPDEGIFVSETQDPLGEWSPLRPLVEGKGLIDPCPLWDGDKCYLAVAFAKSRAGFNSRIGLYEVDPDLTKTLSDGYKIIYDGHDQNPTIEGPKLHKKDGYFYVSAPAGSVKSGWQTVLRSKNIYGPYESKIVLMQGDTLVNGPHQGALIDLPNGGWTFMHFQDLRPYGRVVHLQPVEWVDGWPLCGQVNDKLLAGTPVPSAPYPVDVGTDFKLQECDYFGGETLSLMWQTPANIKKEWYRLDGGLRLFCQEKGAPLCDYPRLFTTKLTRLNFTAEAEAALDFKEEGDSAGFAVTGEEYAYVSVTRKGGKNRLTLTVGEKEIFSREYAADTAIFSVTAVNKNIYDMVCTFKVNGNTLPYEFSAKAGRWVGAKLGIFAANSLGKKGGSATFKRFEIK